ncbi:UvrD-helicase domain-containing protein [Pseudoxanthomonas mexicana]
MTQASDEQLQIIDAPLAPMSVIACAGSGKTFTAVRRLAQMRRQLGNHRGRVALLSFSNIAVDTFRREYQELLDQNTSTGIAYGRVEIDTLDGFITTNVLRPHAYRTMGCDRAPFLVAGTEPFLQNRDFKFWAQPVGRPAFPVNPPDLHKVVVNLHGGQPTFHLRSQNNLITINNGAAVTTRLGALGAYTHDLGRYWCHRTLIEQPGILRALAHRYPHILIDEAQDVGTVHQAIIEQLIDAGSQVSLIGDPNQGIYEFAGANGTFLTQYGQRPGVTQLGLTRNYRSVHAVLDLANRLSARTDTAERAAPDTTHGTYFVPYRNADLQNLVAAFQAAVLAADLKLERSAVLCRGRLMANKLAGNEGAPGQGTVKSFAQATILRDRHQDYRGAFKLVVAGIVGLLADPPHGLAARIAQPVSYTDEWALRRLVWAFTRNPEMGLPAATLTANAQWHELMLQRTRTLLARIAQDHGLASVGNLGNRLARTGLPAAPLIATADLAANNMACIRTDTVHQAKGESLDAVLYLAAKKEHASALLAGVDTEVGRIGYVAVTRARNLLWLCIPANSLEELRPALLARGLQEVGAAAPA